MAPPPFSWRPDVIVEVPPPRRLPNQDHAAIDDEEAHARTVTYGIAAVVAALIIVLFCAVAGRLVF
jgi:hypothetical protein